MAVRTTPAERNIGLDALDCFIRSPNDTGESDLLGPMPLPEALEKADALSQSPKYTHSGLSAMVVITPASAAAWVRRNAHRRPEQR